jgi:hypothetical protein
VSSTVQSAYVYFFSHTTLCIRFYHYFHFTEEEIGPERKSNLPKVTQPVNSVLNLGSGSTLDLRILPVLCVAIHKLAYFFHLYKDRSENSTFYL